MLLEYKHGIRVVQLRSLCLLLTGFWQIHHANATLNSLRVTNHCVIIYHHLIIWYGINFSIYISLCLCFTFCFYLSWGLCFCLWFSGSSTLCRRLTFSLRLRCRFGSTTCLWFCFSCCFSCCFSLSQCLLLHHTLYLLLILLFNCNFIC